jgi:hypothetical protein
LFCEASFDFRSLVANLTFTENVDRLRMAPGLAVVGNCLLLIHVVE